ncbi:MAG: hypothetical protein CMN27_11635 [Salinisphaera sp.]|nr:hypothetical protein [Salinisphaera sp.]
MAILQNGNGLPHSGMMAAMLRKIRLSAHAGHAQGVLRMCETRAAAIIQAGCPQMNAKTRE